jgi:thiol-disulfide isomerase/thioredoxin
MTQAAPCGGSHRTPKSRTGPPRAGRSARPSRWPFALVAAVVVVAGVVAVAVSRGGSSDGGTAAATAVETAPVTVTGTPLPATPAGANGLIDPATDPAVGMAVPTLAGVTFDGSPVVVGTPGRPTIVAFVAHWCPHCQAEVPRLLQWRTDGSLSTAVDWTTVSTSVAPSGPNYPPSAWLDRVGWTAPVLADSTDATAGQAWGLQSFPYLVAVRADGTVAARGVGELTLDQVRTLVAAAAGSAAAAP